MNYPPSVSDLISSPIEISCNDSVSRGEGALLVEGCLRRAHSMVARMRGGESWAAVRVEDKDSIAHTCEEWTLPVDE